MMQNTSSAVMQQRLFGSRDDDDYFPTPPWAVKAFVNFLEMLDPKLNDRLIWEPAAGGLHMAYGLRCHGATVAASSLHPFDACLAERMGVLNYGVQDFLTSEGEADWIITNPPFTLALEFIEHALARADVGIAMLCRSSFSEGAERYERLFGPLPPSHIVQYSERVPMVKGRWDPDASSATSYSWYVWRVGEVVSGRAPSYHWIPPGAKRAYHRREDLEMFGLATATDLFGRREA